MESCSTDSAAFSSSRIPGQDRDSSSTARHVLTGSGCSSSASSDSGIDMDTDMGGYESDDALYSSAVSPDPLSGRCATGYGDRVRENRQVDGEDEWTLGEHLEPADEETLFPVVQEISLDRDGDNTVSIEFVE